MIAADKKVFETHFAAENFMIHKKMLSYYQGGMQGTTIASLATIHMMFSDIMRNEVEHEDSNYYKMFFVYALCVMGIVCAFMNAVLSTTVKIFGNAALLCEASDDEVVQIIRGVRHKQEECTRWWLAALVLIALQGAAWSWDSGNTPVIVTESFVNIGVLCLAVYYGRKTIRLFSPDSNDSGPLVFKTSLFAQFGGDMKTDDRKSKMQMLRSNSTGTNGSQYGNMNDDEINRELSKLRNEYRQRLKAITWDGVLWSRNLQHAHDDPAEGVFTKTYAVLDNGSLHFYKSKDEFMHFTSTVDENHTVKLLDYELESNAKRVAGLVQQGVSLNKTLRSAVFGTTELSFVDMMAADFDVVSASSAYKFCLVPKQTSELSVHEPIFLMAEDKKNFTECMRSLRDSLQAYEDLQAVFGVNRGARLVMDPKAALAFLHDRGTARQMEATEKEHARQVKGKLKVQASTRVLSDSSDLAATNSPYDQLTAALQGDGSDVKTESDLPTSSGANPPATNSGNMLSNLGKSLSLKKPGSLGGGGGGKLDKKALALERQLEIRARLKAIEGRGVLWTKSVNPIKSPRSFLSEKYAVLDNGKLYFYQSKDNFIELGDTLADPINLRDFKVSEDRSIINKHDVKSGHFSLMRYVRQAVNDTNEIRSRDRLGISFDYLTAVNNFKFCLKPSSSRANRSGYYGIICMAESKKAYNHWLALFRSAIECLDELDALSVSSDYKESIQVSLTLDAEELVKKNNHKIKHTVDLT